MTFAAVSCDAIWLLKALATDLAGEAQGGRCLCMLAPVPVQGGLLAAGEPADLTLQRFLSSVDAPVDDQVAAGAERPGAEFTDVVPGVTVQLHMLLQMFLEIEGLSTGWLWAGEGLLVDVLVLLMVIQILPVGEYPSATRVVTRQQLLFGSFPNSLGANLCTVLIPGYRQSRLDLTSRAGQRLSLLGHLKGRIELRFPLIFYRQKSSRTQ